MFEDKTEQEARREILESVGEYCKKYKLEKKLFSEGDRITYAARVYDEREMQNLVDSALEFWLTTGKYAERFEKEFSDFLGVR